MSHKKCVHNKRQSRCIDCGGNEICVHKLLKYNCKDCNGTNICIHSRHKNICKDCKGSQICKHNRKKYTCKECNGGSICEHNKIIYDCKDCNGSGICIHKKHKRYCKDCGGSQICEHYRRKARCRECGGSQICSHNKQKSQCKECGGSQLCKSEWCKTNGSSKYEGYCMICFIHLFPDKPNTRNYKTKEKAVVEYVFQQFPQDKYSWINDKRVYDGCSKRRPDLFLDLGYQVIIVEVDENQHQDYDCSCENKRLMELSKDIGHRPLIFIRFNPDEYSTKDNKITSCWSINKLGVCTIKKTKQKEWISRLEVLKNQIEYWCQESSKTDKTVEVIQLFYDTDKIS